ncbi:unnamed protein product [Trifolium pratense]|uniref:Uncharacterized protein n=1 Tax=Trifolium pratense TaxID=57577 RepID=A0ACB0JH93_TRIPR|nr:unnamed protein product [Trifolium pratense]
MLDSSDLLVPHLQISNEMGILLDSSQDGEVLFVILTYSFLASQYQEEWSVFGRIFIFQHIRRSRSFLKELFETAAVRTTK